MKVKTNNLLLYLLYVTLVTLILTFCLIRYPYWNMNLVLFWTSFYFFGYILISDYIRHNSIFTFGILFNLFGALYTNYYILMLVLGQALIDDYAFQSMRLSYLSIISFNIAYYGIRGGRSGKMKLFPSRTTNYYSYNIKRIMICVATLFFLSLFAEWYIIIRKTGLSAFVQASRAEKSLMTADYSILTFYQSTIPLITTISFAIALDSKRKTPFVLFLLSLCIAIFNAWVRASRAELICILIPILYLLRYYNKISNKTVFILGIICFLFFGIWKSLYSAHRTISYNSEFNTWYRISRNVLASGFQYRFGGTYLQTILNLFLPVTNTTPLSKWYLQNYEPDVLLRGGGRGFSGVLEAYMNFGIFGNFLIFFIYGILLKKIEWRKREQEKSCVNYQLILTLIIMTSMYLFYRGESYSLWKNMAWFKIYPTALFFLLARMKPGIQQKPRSEYGR